MTLLDMRREYERIRNSWRSRPPAEHRFDLARLGELRTEAEESNDEGTEQLLVELEDLIAQIAHHGPQHHLTRQSSFVEPSDSM
jgi:hypothetical protein